MSAAARTLIYYPRVTSREGRSPFKRNSLRQDPRTNEFSRWPLVFRFIKGAIHAEILLPVFLHALFTIFVVYLDTYVFDTVGLPSTIVSTQQT